MDREQDELKQLSQPKVDLLLIADRAEVVAGKLYVMGGIWDAMWISDLSQPSLFSVAVAVEVPWDATNVQHHIRLAIEDKDSNLIAPIGETSFMVGRPPWAQREVPQRATFAIPFVSVTFPGYDLFVLRAYLNGEAARRVTFRTLQPQPSLSLTIPPPAPPSA